MPVSDVEAFAAALKEATETADQQNPIDQLDEDASIQYEPPNNNFADEIYYPPMKRMPDLV